jgi:hypothetical protein
MNFAYDTALGWCYFSQSTFDWFQVGKNSFTRAAPTGQIIAINVGDEFETRSGAKYRVDRINVVNDRYDRTLLEDGLGEWAGQAALWTLLSAIQNGFFKLVPRDSSQQPQSTPPKPEPIHREVISFRRGQQVPDSVLTAAMDRGEKTIRRTLREWPWGKSLDRKQISGEAEIIFEWFWT